MYLGSRHCGFVNDREERIIITRNEKPNILLITTDQQRADCLGIAGHPVVQTPNLDWLARTGTRFERGYSECPSCVPARRTLMSGQAPDVQGMVGMVTGVDWDPPQTLAGELGKAGYQTHLVGKLHLHPVWKRYGFDHMELADSTHEHGGPNDYVDWLRATSGLDKVEPGVAHGVSGNGWVGRPSHLLEHQTHTFWCVSRAIEFLEKRDPTVPFFLNLSFIDPHPPLTPPQFYYDRYMNQELPKPVVGDWAPRFDGPEKGTDINASRICLDDQTMKQARAAYYGLINHVDDQIGRLVGALRERGLLDDSVIMFTSDHGEMLGDHNMYRKTFPYEASARVPFFIRLPVSMGCQPSVVGHAPVGLQDVLPTLLDIAGVPVPETVTGRSVLPLIQDENGANWRDLLYGEHAGFYEYSDGSHFVTDGHSKYIWFSQTGREHLFDLDNDPNELHDLTLQPSPPSLHQWRQRLIEHLKGRPEQFVENDQLVVGRAHDNLVPGRG